MKLALCLSLLAAFSSLVWSEEEEEPEANEIEIPHTTLHGGQLFPLVGFGVGNLEHELIQSHVAESMISNYRMVDTAHASGNEALIVKGVEDGLIKIPDAEMHVVTKVWYTYLGYERTKISVKESLEALKHPNIKIHMLLHWPHCLDDIPWMNCEEEEDALPQAVKDAGLAPHLDKDNAYKESWRALEDFFLGKVSLGDDLPKIESIGVSNFDLHHLQELAKTSRVKPHILQGHVWSVIYDPRLMEYIREESIHYQAYNVISGILGGFEAAPHARDALFRLADTISGDLDDGEIHPSQLILAWLTQQHISVIPRTTSTEHLRDNSPVAIGSLPELEEQEVNVIEEASGALLRREDLQKAQLSFVNKLSEVLHVFWFDHDDEEEVPVKMELQPGETWHTEAFEGNTFIAYDSNEVRREYVVTAGFGELEEFHIEPDL